MNQELNKTCSIICSYNPEVNNLKELCLVLLNYGTVIIVDNTRNLNKSDIFDTDNIIIIKPKVNLGTLKAYNLVINQHPEFHFFWLWNQDSMISISDAGKFLNKSFHLFENDEKMIATTIYDPKNLGNPLMRKEILIRESTTLFNIKRFNSFSLDFFDEKLFMDYGDWDLSYRIQKAGGNINQILGISCEHSYGDPEKTIFGDFYRSSEIRLYMQGLNSIYLVRKHGFLSFISFLLFIRFFILPFKNFIFKNSYSRSKMYFKGILNGIKGETSSVFIAKLNINI